MVYGKVLDDAKQRSDRKLRKPVLQDLNAFVKLFDLRMIQAQHPKPLDAQDNNKRSQACSWMLRATMGLPCTHEIELVIVNVNNNG